MCGMKGAALCFTARQQGTGSPYVSLPGSRGRLPYVLLPGGVGRVGNENASILPGEPARRYSRVGANFPLLPRMGGGG